MSPTSRRRRAFVPRMPLHPRISREAVGVARSPDHSTVAVDDRHELRLPPPGVLGEDWGGMTPIGMLMGHAAYGLVLAPVYDRVAA